MRSGVASLIATGYEHLMRIGNVEIRPFGGGLGCLLMILLSIVASVALTAIMNLLLLR